MEKSPFEQFEELKIDIVSRSFLTEIAKWANFLAILGYVGLGLMILAAVSIIIVGSSVSIGPIGSGIWISIIYILFAGIYFFPITYLYKFSSNMKIALRTNDQKSLTNAFEYLKSHYKFIGIITIIILGFYILAIAGAIMTTLGRA